MTITFDLVGLFLTDKQMYKYVFIKMYEAALLVIAKQNWKQPKRP